MAYFPKDTLLLIVTDNPREMWSHRKNNETFEEHNYYNKKGKSNRPHRARVRIKHNKYHYHERYRNTDWLTVKHKQAVIKN